MRKTLLALIIVTSTSFYPTSKDNYVYTTVDSFGNRRIKMNSWLSYCTTNSNWTVTKKGFLKLPKAERDSLFKDAKGRLYTLEKHGKTRR